MTPIDLLEQLRAFTQEAVGDLIMPTAQPPGLPPLHRAPEVWLMRLGGKKADESRAPYILLQLLTGTDNQLAGEAPESRCTVRVVFCAYSESADEGALYVLNMLTRLRLALLQKRVVGGRYTLQMPLEYLIYPNYPEDTAPFYGGEMITLWEMPTIKREVPLSWETQS